MHNHDDNPHTAVPPSSAISLPVAIGCFFGVRSAFTVVAVRLFGSPPQLGAAVSLATEFSLLGLVCLDLLRPVDARIDVRTAESSSRDWVLLYLAFTGVSLFWSAASSLAASLAYWSGTACDVGMLSLLLSRRSPQQVSLCVMKGFVWGACIVALAAWLMPAQYDLRLGDEDYFNANTIANLSVFGFFFSVCLRHFGWGRYRFISVFLAITVLRSLSKSAIAAFVISSAVLVIQDRMMTRKTKLGLTGAAFCVVLLFWGLFEAYYDLYTTTGNQALTLTGRTAIWTYVVENIPEHLWIGHGFDSMWKIVPAFGTFEPRHAENEILQQLYAYGLAGAVMLVGIYGSAYLCVRRLADPRARLIMLSLLIFVLVRGIAEAEPFDLLLPLWMVVLLSSFTSSLRSSAFRTEFGSTPGTVSPFCQQ
jgi:exopolysaccharide production protein ExoQ